jgi:hypothetical protein
MKPRLLTTGLVTELRQELYQRPGAPARLVIIGGPGAGKTTSMMLLLIDVLHNRTVRDSQPVPVWVTFGGWDPTSTTTLHEWAAETLSRDYPGLTAYGGPGVAAELIRTRRVALFLDGLDEVPDKLRGPTLEAIDRDSEGLRIVLTSRSDEYRNALTQGRLWGPPAVIDVLPIDPGHARDFLLDEQLGRQRDRWKKVTAHLRKYPDSVAARTLITPLALSLARDTYTDRDPAELLDATEHPTPEALLRHLLIGFLDTAYPDPAERQHAVYWLSWVARQLGPDRDLQWWDILTWYASDRDRRRWTAGLVVRALKAPANDLQPHTFIVRWPRLHEMMSILALGLTLGLTGGLAIGLAAGLAFGLVIGLAYGISVGLVAPLVFGVLFGLFELWSRSPVMAGAVSPAEVYTMDRRRTLTGALQGGLVSALAIGLSVGVTVGLAAGPAPGLGLGLAYGLAAGLAFGLLFGMIEIGPASILTTVEFVARLHGPRFQFMRLLQVAQDKQVLRQVGVIYQFRHAALQDLLAAAPPDAQPTTRAAATAQTLG